ncbi:MnhB domain-containing protein [Xanthobacter sp. DSM 24535]|uniref:MnhB domain-containing protein n=1 Tax=Roseixanthobacter psychrophilus TaxID=3119917 RepID=UPI003728B871
MSLVLDSLLALLAVALALRVLLARDALAAAIGFIGLGLLLALLWVRLDAVDVALTEAAIGSGVTGLVLLRATGPMRPPAPQGAAVHLLAALLAVAVFCGLSALVLTLPEPAPSLADAAAAHLEATGLGNPVTAVLLVYRALDTLLETVVLLVALIGVWSLSGETEWTGAPPPLWQVAATPPLEFLARVLPPVAILMGLYLFWTGADKPGGAFQGGAVLAAAWLLVLLAGLRAPPRAEGGRLRALLLLGPALFLGVGGLGVVFAGAFLAYPEGFAKPIILLVEAAITLSIAVTLGLLVLDPPQKPGAGEPPPEAGMAA